MSAPDWVSLVNVGFGWALSEPHERDGSDVRYIRADLAAAYIAQAAEITRLQALIPEAYALGFEASGEGYNGEYPTMEFRNDVGWQEMRDDNLAALSTFQEGGK